MKRIIEWALIILIFVVFFAPTILGFMTGNHWYNALYLVSWIPAYVLGQILDAI